MDTKTLKILAGIFLIALLVVMYPTIQRRFFPQQSGKSEISFDGISKGSVNSVSLEQNGERLTLSQQGSSWNIASYSASMDKVNGFFDAIKDSKATAIVSKNSNNSAEYGLATNAAILITFHPSTGSEIQLLVGKSGSATNTYYAKNKGSDNVYLVDGNLADLLSVKTSDWRDRQVSPTSVDSINSIEVNSSDSFKLQKNADSSWQLTVNEVSKSLPSADIQPLIDRLGTLTASDFYNDKEMVTNNNSSQSRIVVIKDKDGKVLSKMNIITDDAYYRVSVEGKSDVYKVAGYNLDDFFSLIEKQR